MSDGLVRDLTAEIARGQAVIVVGAGVAASASGGSPVASWTGLLESGISWCEEYVPSLPIDWAGLVRGFVGLGDVSSLLAAAEQVTDRLGGREGGEYRRWLHETLAALTVLDKSVPEALAALGAPVATTNYDGLLEAVSGWAAVTWREGARIQRVLRGDEPAVVHLHGFWNDPVSVVLGVRSYDHVLGDAATQALQRAMATMRSLVFVGVGAGAGDPNIGALRHWLTATFPGDEYRHFRLCLTSEVAGLAVEHKDERIVPVAYGANHGDLAGFLRRLAPQPGRVRSSTAAARPAGPSGLPARRPTLGRAEELAEMVASLMAEPAGSTLVLGAPGIGKTNLTVAALHDPSVASRFGDRRFFVPCETSASAAGVLTALATILGVPLGGVDIASAVAARLGSSGSAVVLDNAETPWEADTLVTEELFALLAAIPGVALVVSVRGTERPGGPAWRRIVRLEPLGFADARALFLSIAGDRFDTPGLSDLLVEMGGVPLAVELLAHTAEGEPDIATIAERWRTERVCLLEKGAADHRLLSVAVSLESSWAGPMMTDDGRRLLSLLGVLAEGVAHRDLELLVPGAGAAGANVLRRRGLAFDRGGRVRTYPPVRLHVAAAHRPSESDWRHAIEHYRRLATEHGSRVGRPGGADAAIVLAAETANLEAALSAALEDADPTAGIDAVHALRDFARFTGVKLAGLRQGALDASRRTVDSRRTANALFDIGLVAMSRSDHDDARRRYQQALPLYQQIGDVHGEANCIQGLGDIAFARYDHNDARARYQQALPLYQQIGDMQGEANCIQSLGDIALDRHGHDDAGGHYQQALPLFQQIGDLLGEANCIKSLGDIALDRHDHDDARGHYQQAFSLYQQVGSVRGEANCIKSLGDIALDRYDHNDAQARYQQALPLYQQIGNVVGEAGCIQGLGDIALARSDHDDAEGRYQQALVLYERIPEPYSIGMVHRRLARLTESDDERETEVAAARRAWTSIDRNDLLLELDAEFGEPS